MSTHTTIKYQLATAHRVSLKVYDIAGQLVRTLATGHEQAGSHEILWDSRDTRGNQVASGVYFVQLEAGENTATKKILLIK
jgi:flagellar hook assembly protein FlgD